MHYSYSVPAAIVRWVAPAAAMHAAFRQVAQGRAEADRRWPMILRKLAALRKRNRRSIRIVDANCGAGELLKLAVTRARVLGFTAIEGRGIDSDPLLIARAKASAAGSDPAIGLIFEVGDPREALREEAEFPADLVLYAGQGDAMDGLAGMARAAGRTVLRDTGTARLRSAA